MPAEPRKEYVNIYGRKGGRGARPYLIVLKLICVAAFLGGLMTLLALTLTAAQPRSQEDWQRRAELISRAYRWVIVPGVTGAEIVGVLLLSSIWRVMIRMRWFVLKAALILVCVPGLHLFMSSRSTDLHVITATSPDLSLATTVQTALLAGTSFALALGIGLLILGRIKPRLGQDYAQTFNSKKRERDDF